MITFLLILIYTFLVWKWFIDRYYWQTLATDEKKRADDCESLVADLREIIEGLENELAHERTSRNNERAAEVRNRMKEMEEDFKIRQKRIDERRDKWKVKGE